MEALTREQLTREILRLAVPAVLQTLFQTAQFLLDTLMIGKYGGDDPTPLAAMSVVGPVCWSMTVIFTITSVGATAIVSRRIGEGRDRAATQAAVTAITLSILCGLGIAILGSPARGAVVSFFASLYGGEGGEVAIAAAEGYLRWFILFFPLRAVVVTLEASLRGAGETMIPFWGGVLANCANVLGNACFIFGLWGAPHLGVEGAGLATGLAPAVELLFIAAALGLARRPRLHIGLHWIRDTNSEVARELLRVSGPALLGALIFHSGFLVYQAAILGLDPESIAAHRVAITLQSLGFLPAAGFYISAASLSGRLLGAGDLELAREAARRNLRLGLLFIAPISGGFIVAAEPLVSLFTEIPSTVSIAAICLLIGALELPFLVITESLNGTLRGAGSTRVPTVITAIGTWGVRVPFSWILARWTPLGLTGIWVATVLDWLVRGILTQRAVKRGDWLKERV